eukprot:CAMPEP_0182582464 /NCGR_PEP_ID=MMETSP1324-20130603/52661_1 /TAXON_ID=236786 /ORGANISM="Florenciella sp., Strain RCC1587" /LENGTH=122 /DNA_ID=CAMNT_0024798933 /DNA_START=45 /DNA_END=409 /DNA_ORIENTATION=+
MAARGDAPPVPVAGLEATDPLSKATNPGAPHMASKTASSDPDPAAGQPQTADILHMLKLLSQSQSQLQAHAQMAEGAQPASRAGDQRAEDKYESAEEKKDSTAELYAAHCTVHVEVDGLGIA